MKRFLYFIGYTYGIILGYSFILYLAYKDGYSKILRKKRPDLFFITPEMIKAIRKDTESKVLAEYRDN